MASCWRKVAFKYWGEDFGIPREPQSDGQKLGTELHSIAEAYLVAGVQPDRLTKAGELFIAALPFLPPPGSGGVEGEFTMRASGVEYTGIIDYRGNLAWYDGMRRVVLDHKTSKSPKKYGLWSKTQFLEDPQAVIYAARDMIEAKRQGLPDADSSRLRWLYYPTTGAPKPLPSDICLNWPEVEDAFGKIIHPVASRLVQLKKQRPDPLTLEPNASECDKYGGCSYKGLCKLSAKEMFAGAVAQFGATKPEPVTTEVRQMGDDLHAKLLARAAKNGASSAGAVPAAVPAAPQIQTTVAPASTSAGATATERDPINPPEARAATKPPVSVAQIASDARATSGVRPSSNPSAAVAGELAHVVGVVCAELSDAFAAIAKRLGA